MSLIFVVQLLFPWLILDAFWLGDLTYKEGKIPMF